MISTPTTAVLQDDDHCFGCGKENAIGLHLEFAWKGDLYETRWIPQQAHQGWAGRVHGGLIAVVLDEILSRAALTRHGHIWVTAELTTRLMRPAWIGMPLIGQAWIERLHPRLILCRGEIREEDSGVLVASGHTKLMPAK